jgi:hypothetical protein
MNKKINHQIIMLLSISLMACTTTPVQKTAVKTQNAGVVSFSNISINKTTHAIIIRGNVKKRAQAGKRITIPGHIHITLKASNGTELETIQARTHRKFKNSKAWHFDGKLKRLPTADSEIVVKFHNHH